MTEENPAIEKSEPRWLKPIVDYMPLAAFFIAYWYGDIMLATKVIMGATAFAVVLSLIVAKRIPIMPLVTATVVGIFGGLTIYLEDDTFIKMKPTIVQLAFASILGIGLLFNRLWLKPLFGKSMDMPDDAWRTLSLRFVVFFLASAVANELVWRTQSTDFWVNFKIFGILGLTFAFIATQLPFIHKHGNFDEDEQEK